MGIIGRDVLRTVLGADAWEMTPEEIIAVIRRISSPDWQNNFRQWIEVIATGQNSQVPSDEQILEWLKEPEVLIKVSALARRIPVSWLRNEEHAAEEIKEI